jgi:hypothetical protein
MVKEEEMPNEKDRLGDKLRDVERGREDQYFAHRDRELVEKLKRSKQAETEATLKELARMRCPKCGERLQQRTVHEITLDECPSCGGIWLDMGEFEELASRESEGWFGRLLRTRKG